MTALLNAASNGDAPNKLASTISRARPKMRLLMFPAATNAGRTGDTGCGGLLVRFGRVGVRRCTRVICDK